jgi:hypothetical protein
MTVATSPFDLPQNEQQNPRAFIFAIIVVWYRQQLRMPERVRRRFRRASLAMRDHLVY